jgi:hypothetical protein
MMPGTNKPDTTMVPYVTNDTQKQKRWKTRHTCSSRMVE